MKKLIKIDCRDYWFKVVEMLQQNWALIENYSDETYKIFFISDTSGLFDEIEISSLKEAMLALRRNGFSRYTEDKNAQRIIAPPEPPFHQSPHPNGLIYSSGRYWR